MKGRWRGGLANRNSCYDDSGCERGKRVECRLEKNVTRGPTRETRGRARFSIRKFGTFVLVCVPPRDLFSRVIKRALTNGRVFNDRYAARASAELYVFSAEELSLRIICTGDICASR